MEIEWLKFQVAPEQREQFVQKDEEIWTATLAQYSGFLSKETWISPEDLAEVILVVHWASFEAWQSVPTQVLDQAEARFRQAMGDTYKLIEGKRYQVRKRIQGSISSIPA